MKNSLISITSCNRIDEVKKYILPYIDFVNKNADFHFILAHDGFSNEYIEFCIEFEIPLIYSDDREGVGLSKNRVLKQFPDFDYYFFIDDDVELISNDIFQLHIDISQKAQPNFHHLSSTSLFEILDTTLVDNQKVLFSNRGGGYFNFFTKEGIETVGGWHTEFAKYKRYGHTEHSLRFVNSNLSKYPFVVIEECINMLILHNPLHVTEPDGVNYDKNDVIFNGEKKIINQKISHFKIATVSPFHYLEFSTSHFPIIKTYLEKNTGIYPLTHKNRNIALAEYYFLRISNSKSKLQKFKNFCLSFFYKPNSIQLKHWVKTIILRK